MSHEHLNEQPAEPTYTPEEAIAAGYRIMGDKVFERVSVRDCDKEDLVCVGRIGPRPSKKSQANKHLNEQSLRDKFAGQALPGLMSIRWHETEHALLADHAYRIADAMLKRREQ